MNRDIVRFAVYHITGIMFWTMRLQKSYFQVITGRKKINYDYKEMEFYRRLSTKFKFPSDIEIWMEDKNKEKDLRTMDGVSVGPWKCLFYIEL